MRLFHEKSLLNCDGLWDTGSMVCMAFSGRLPESVPDAKLMSLEKFLKGDDLHLVVANNTSENVSGVKVLMFRVCLLKVPVTDNALYNPIIGYNVNKHIARSGIKDLPQVLLV